ncbi:hypothetical protein [Corynebacterium auriscanis]|uniref:hypothetical protein n=1 Tax=Corynebacterium auriscanis TaxID=99807 RepID=UPI003CF6C41E
MNNSNTALLRSQLWSPVQNTALWLGWWLHDVISTDDVIDAFQAVQGKHHRFVFDATFSPPTENSNPRADRFGLIELLRYARRVTEDAGVELEDRPLVSLVLAGPGDVPPLPANTTAARAVAEAGAGIAIADGDPDVTHVVIPRVIDNSVIEWTWYTAFGPTPTLRTYGPGEADAGLREASDKAARLIEMSNHHQRRGGVAGDGRRFEMARLAVGSLSVAFGLPGLPAGVSQRAARLMARADALAAIIEVTQRSEIGANLDAELLPILRAVRLARMVAVDYAMRELVR